MININEFPRFKETIILSSYRVPQQIQSHNLRKDEQFLTNLSYKFLRLRLQINFRMAALLVIYSIKMIYFRTSIILKLGIILGKYAFRHCIVQLRFCEGVLFFMKLLKQKLKALQFEKYCFSLIIRKRLYKKIPVTAFKCPETMYSQLSSDF